MDISKLILLFFPAILFSQEINSAKFCLNVVKNGRVEYTQGESMCPTFDSSYFIITEKRPFESLKKGDIIIFRRKTIENNNIYIERIIHRIVAKSSDGTVVITKGDNNPTIDPDYITKENYECLAVGWIRRDSLCGQK